MDSQTTSTTPKLGRHAYLEYVAGTSSKFYLITLTTEPGGSFSVEGLFGRIGNEGKEAPKYAGSDLAEAVKAYDKMIGEKLKKGYREVTLPIDRGDPGGIRHGEYLRVERGASLWTWQPELEAPMSLPGVSLAEARKLDARTWRFEGPGIGPESGRTIWIIGDEPGSRGIAIAPGGRRIGVELLSPDITRELRDAGMAPIVFETVGRWVRGARHIVTDVWQVGGQDLSSMPGSERALLRDQVVATASGLDIPPKASGPAADCRGYSLLDGQRVTIVT